MNFKIKFIFAGLGLLLTACGGGKKEVASVDELGTENSGGPQIVKVDWVDEDFRDVVPDGEFDIGNGRLLNMPDNLCALDRYVAFQAKSTSAKPCFDGGFGSEPVCAERIVNVVIPTEFVVIPTQFGRNLVSQSMIRTARGTLIEKAFPEEYRVYDEGTYSLVFQRTADKWLAETVREFDSDYGSQGIAIGPWSSNDSFVQMRVDTHNWEGGNSDMHEVKFFTFARNCGWIGSIFGFLDNYDQSMINRLVGDALREKMIEETGESFEIRTYISNDYCPPLSLEPDGVCFWFPAGTISMAYGIVPVTVSYSKLQPYMDEGVYSIATQAKNWHTFEPLSTYGDFD